MAWESPWGRGFPGWHIECSAMSMRYLGQQIDVHTGGVDNIFPHHEDEIAQSEAYTGQRFVRFWVHAQHLLSDGLKMAKSTGNSYTLADAEARGYAPLSLRYFYTTAHYRSRINFTFGALTAAQTALRRLRARAIALDAASGETGAGDESFAQSWRERFLTAIEDDLNLPLAMAALWEMLREGASRRDVSPQAQLSLLLEMDRILGFDLAADLEAARRFGEAAAWRDETALTRVPPVLVLASLRKRTMARTAGDYARADAIREEALAGGWRLRDRREDTLALPRPPEEEFTVLSRSADAPERRGDQASYAISVNLLAHNSRDDLQRCIVSLLRHAAENMEIVVVDNGSTDDTLAYLRELARTGTLRDAAGSPVGLQVLFADHDMGFAAGRNATIRASRGHFLVLLDTSIELAGPIWPRLLAALRDEQIGVVGPYGLVTDDLREFREYAGPDVDAVEGYMLAFRRSLLRETGLMDERFRFYRLLDIHFSFFVRAAGYRVLALPELSDHLVKHPHREWFSLSEEEQRTRSKKNYDLFRARWHHGESLLVANYRPTSYWPGHDHALHVAAQHTHAAEDLPAPGAVHSHMHHHWPDHTHEHPHVHEALTRR
jgi:cysteinyl-tRNA synthetase